MSDQGSVTLALVWCMWARALHRRRVDLHFNRSRFLRGHKLKGEVEPCAKWARTRARLCYHAIVLSRDCAIRAR